MQIILTVYQTFKIRTQNGGEKKSSTQDKQKRPLVKRYIQILQWDGQRGLRLARVYSPADGGVFCFVHLFISAFLHVSTFNLSFLTVLCWICDRLLKSRCICRSRRLFFFLPTKLSSSLCLSACLSLSNIQLTSIHKIFIAQRSYKAAIPQ